MPLLSTTIKTPLGPMIAGALDDKGLCLLEFDTRPELDAERRELADRFDSRWKTGSCELLAHAARLLEAYFDGERTDFDIPLMTPGTEFQQRVWAALRGIAFGETMTYAELAERAGNPAACRAAGAANGRNRIAIVVPCHRVVASNGLGGYAGGLDRKRWLIEHEREIVVPPIYGVSRAQSLV